MDSIMTRSPELELRISELRRERLIDGLSIVGSGVGFIVANYLFSNEISTLTLPENSHGLFSLINYAFISLVGSSFGMENLFQNRYGRMLDARDELHACKRKYQELQN